MIRIAIVEDDSKWTEKLSEFLDRYEREEKISFFKTFFSDGYEIAENYRAQWDIILMDIEMVLMNGMEAAEKIRKQDEQVIIIFITNMAQYAISGYRVNALDYVLKPIEYFAFSESLKRAVRQIPKEEEYIVVAAREETCKIKITDLCWVESRGHRLTFVTDQADYETTVYSMKEIEERLSPMGFARCNAGYLVNLSKVDGIVHGNVRIREKLLPISRGKKTDFMAALTKEMTC